MKIYTNTAPTPSRVLGLLRLLEALGGPVPQGRLTRLIDPTTEHPEKGGWPQDVREVVEAAAELGLVAVEKFGGEESVGLKKGVTPAALPRLAASAALQPKVGGKENPFAMLCAWLLTRPPLGCPQGHNALREALRGDGFDAERFGVRNPARIDMLLYWAQYLGLVERVNHGGGKGVVPDPTEFLRRDLDALLPPGKPREPAAFRAELGRRCPVLDGGAAREAALKRMNAAPADGRLSEALAQGLRRLRAEGELHWTYKDDARTFLDLGRERVSDFRRGRDPNGAAR
jgi:hypothetical protein